MILPFTCGFDHLLDNVRRGRLIRIPHAEVDDVFTPLPCFQLQCLNLREDIRRQSLDSIKPVAQPHEVPLTVRAGECSPDAPWQMSLEVHQAPILNGAVQSSQFPKFLKDFPVGDEDLTQRIFRLEAVLAPLPPFCY